MLVGVPSTFPKRGGTAQTFWGLLICFMTFGAYMMLAPFIVDSDDFLSQMAQMQIFLTLLSSLALRASPPSEIVGTMVTVILFAVPTIAVLVNTPLLELLGRVVGKLKGLLVGRCTNCKPPPLQRAAVSTPRADSATDGGTKSAADTAKTEDVVASTSTDPVSLSVTVVVAAPPSSEAVAPSSEDATLLRA